VVITNAQSMTIRSVFLLFFLAMAFTITVAQPGPKWTSGSKSAIKHIERAMKSYETGQSDKALTDAGKAIKADSAFVEAWLLIAEISMDRKDETTAIMALEYAVAIDQRFFPPAMYHLGNLHIRQGNYPKALTFLHRYVSLPYRNETMLASVQRSIANCHFAMEAMQNPVIFNPVNLGEGVNSIRDEYFPSLTVDEQLLLFTRQDADRNNADGWNENLYLSQYRDYLWQPARNIGAPVNTRYNEGASAISPDGQMIVFTSCELMRGLGYGEGRSGYGSCDLFYTYRNGNRWAVPQNLGTPVNTNLWESQPAFDADGRTLYFVRGVAGSYGIDNSDIFYTTLDVNGRWIKPVRLGSEINTPGNEEGVFIHPDGQTLYFASDGHPGLGGYDLFLSRKQPDGSWGKAINLGYPINTSRDETGLIVSSSGKTAYFSSNRDGGYGGQDIYQFELDPSLRPFPVTYLKGVVYDSETTKPISASFELININTGAVVINSWSDPVTGDFLISIPADQTWMLNVSKEGYLFYSDHFELTGSATALKPFQKDIPLQPVKTGESVVLKNIFFDVDKSVLKPESLSELERLSALLHRNPMIKIEISGHTDNTGTATRNQTLSESRAKAVVDYLIGAGIPEARLTFKGYAERLPIADNNTEEGRQLNRRTEFKILSHE
jgi:outer membrane protein OmpA-like peptidoglycan-associated protein